MISKMTYAFFAREAGLQARTEQFAVEIPPDGSDDAGGNPHRRQPTRHADVRIEAEPGDIVTWIDVTLPLLVRSGMDDVLPSPLVNSSPMPRMLSVPLVDFAQITKSEVDSSPLLLSRRGDHDPDLSVICPDLPKLTPGGSLLEPHCPNPLWWLRYWGGGEGV